MKNIRLILLVSFLMGGFLSAQSFRKIDNKAFARGEKLRYRVYYDSFLTGKVTAGEATVEVKKDAKIIGGRQAYHIEALGWSKGAFNFFFKVNNRYESFVDEQALIPWLFIRRTREGGYDVNDDVTFDHYKGLAISRQKTNAIPENAQDILSSYYWARNIDISNSKPGDEFKFNFFLDDSTYNSKIVYLGKENIKISKGKYKALKIKPMVATGNIFKEEFPMEIWVSDDENRILLKGRSGIRVGSVNVELIEYSGLKNRNMAKLE
ncbi:MAG: DUF3108 domain-containing protein [Bacteroidales bacterium]|nr:DUF3108 domain-containing protein [Bacteroidales bacterium]MDY0215486.1 DUF3108 domain-containing protein [Bacteroidales bacterium]